jgi:hypothetical protein
MQRFDRDLSVVRVRRAYFALRAFNVETALIKGKSISAVVNFCFLLSRLSPVHALHLWERTPCYSSIIKYDPLARWCTRLRCDKRKRLSWSDEDAVVEGDHCGYV